MPVSLVILILYIVAFSLSVGMQKNVVKAITKTLLLRDADFLRL